MIGRERLRTWKMSTDRRTMLLQRSKALAAMKDQDLPDSLRAAAKRVVDTTDVALGLRDAIARKAAREAETPKT
jgi:hypothetical protein